MQGAKEGDLAYIKAAKLVFPFDKELLVSEALVSIRNKIVNDKIYFVLKEALKYDPYSVEILVMYIQYALINNNINEARIEYQKLKQISPNSNSFKELEKALKAKGF